MLWGGRRMRSGLLIMLVLLSYEVAAYQTRSQLFHTRIEQACAAGTIRKANNIQALLHTTNVSSDVAAIVEQLQSLTWVNNTDFIEALLEYKQQSLPAAKAFLQSYLAAKLVQDSFPLLTFFHDLKQEEAKINASTSALMAAMGKKGANNGLLVQQCLEMIDILKSNMVTLQALVSSLVV